MTQWFIKILDETKGPYTSSQIRQFAESGELKRDYWIRKGTGVDWKLAESVKGLEFGTQKQTRSSSPPTSRTMRHCPFCEEKIFSDAKKCKHCGEFVPEPSAKSDQSYPPATRFCPFCAEEILSDAKKCKHCGEFVPQLNAKINQSYRPAKILDIALNQKYVIYVILAQFVAWSVSMVLPIVGGILLLVTLIFQLFFVFTFCIANYESGVGVVLGLLSLIPCVGIVVLLIVNSKAIATLKSNGVPVGFWGVPNSSIRELKLEKQA
jgi:hypothetical protein